MNEEWVDKESFSPSTGRGYLRVFRENAEFLLVLVLYTRVSQPHFGERETSHSGKERTVRRARTHPQSL
jgi:hypothetical protein